MFVVVVNQPIAFAVGVVVGITAVLAVLFPSEINAVMQVVVAACALSAVFLTARRNGGDR